MILDITACKQTEFKAAQQLEELIRLRDALLGREDRMLEIEKEVKELLVRLGEPKQRWENLA